MNTVRVLVPCGIGSESRLETWGGRQQSCRAFSLTELLAVLAIIAVMAAILLPVMANSKSSGRKVQSISNMRQIYAGIQIYSQDHDSAQEPPETLLVAVPYVSAREVFRSPADARNRRAEDGKFNAWFFDTRTYGPRSDFQISYVGVYEALRPDPSARWARGERMNRLGYIVDPFFATRDPSFGAPDYGDHMMPRSGPFLRICRDGSLFVYDGKSRRSDGSPIAQIMNMFIAPYPYKDLLR